MTRRSVLLLLLIGVPGVAAAATAKTNDRPVIKVSVKADGRIFADDQECSKAELAGRLDEVKEKGGLVWFHHALRGEADPAAKAAFQLIVERRMAFGLYEDDRFKRRTGAW